MACSNLNLCGLFKLSLAPEGGEEVCAAGAVTKRGGRTKETEDSPGVAVHSGPAWWWHGEARPEAGGWRFTTAHGRRPRSFWWILQVSGARPWPKHQVSLKHWYLDESWEALYSFLLNKCFHTLKIIISAHAGWLNSMKKHLCTSGTCWKGKTRLWLEQHVS